MPLTPYTDGLRDPNPGDLITAEQVTLQNEILRRNTVIPNSINDSGGLRSIVRHPSVPWKIIEITHIDHTVLGFEMKTHGVCLGKYVSFETEEPWNKTYDEETILTYDPDDDEVEEVKDRYIFIGFINQGRAGVPGQRYFGMEYGSKKCDDLELPLVMVDGGSKVACVLADDHPGCGVVFDVWIAPLWDIEMDSNNGDWDLSHATTIWDIEGCDSETVKFKAIDKRKGVPEPLKYATGLFVPRVSKEHGIILEVSELDCDSPGGCYFCEEPAE